MNSLIPACLWNAFENVVYDASRLMLTYQKLVVSVAFGIINALAVLVIMVAKAPCSTILHLFNAALEPSWVISEIIRNPAVITSFSAPIALLLSDTIMMLFQAVFLLTVAGSWIVALFLGVLVKIFCTLFCAAALVSCVSVLTCPESCGFSTVKLDSEPPASTGGVGLASFALVLSILFSVFGSRYTEANPGPEESEPMVSYEFDFTTASGSNFVRSSIEVVCDRRVWCRSHLHAPLLHPTESKRMFPPRSTR